MNTTVLFFLIVPFLLVSVSLLQPIANKASVSPTIFIILTGVAISLMAGYQGEFLISSGIPSETISFLTNPPVDSQVILYTFLPLLLFQVSLMIDFRQCLNDIWAILTMAVVAVLVSTFLIGGSLSVFSGLPLAACLLLGAIVATTDPAAVVAIFRDLGASQRLTRIVEGESLLNDAAAIVLFGIFLGLVAHPVEASFLWSAGQMALMFAGGLALGVVSGWAFSLAFPLLREHRSAQVTTSIALPYAVYSIAESFMGGSGVVAVVAAGIVFSVRGRVGATPGNWTYLEEVWEQLEFIAGALVFVLAALLIPKMLSSFTFHHFGLLMVLVVAATLSRAIVVFGAFPVIGALTNSSKISARYQFVITWGGLRGAMTLALALAVTEQTGVPTEVSAFVSSLATAFVLSSLLLNGLTLKPLLKALGLNELSAVDQTTRAQINAIHMSDTIDAIRNTAEKYGISEDTSEKVANAYRLRSGSENSMGDIKSDISDKEKLKVGLIALVTREREITMRHLDDRSISAGTAGRLLADISRMEEQVRSEGRLGYLNTSRANLRHSTSFRGAQVLHRYLGLHSPLARRVADRFEYLLALRSVANDLLAFKGKAISPVFGDRVAEILAEIIKQRKDEILKEYEALRLQYPKYASALDARFLASRALHSERNAIEVAYERRIIGPELRGSLENTLASVHSRSRSRPKLDMGLRTRDLIDSHPFLKGLTKSQRKRLAKSLKSRFVVPGEVVQKKGDLNKHIWFVADGAVEIASAKTARRLGSGDIFGLPGKDRSKFRRSDVTALSYGKLLYIPKKDFPFRSELEGHAKMGQGA